MSSTQQIFPTTSVALLLILATLTTLHQTGTADASPLLKHLMQRVRRSTSAGGAGSPAAQHHVAAANMHKPQHDKKIMSDIMKLFSNLSGDDDYYTPSDDTLLMFYHWALAIMNNDEFNRCMARFDGHTFDGELNSADEEDQYSLAIAVCFDEAVSTNTI